MRPSWWRAGAWHAQRCRGMRRARADNTRQRAAARTYLNSATSLAPPTGFVAAGAMRWQAAFCSARHYRAARPTLVRDERACRIHRVLDAWAAAMKRVNGAVAGRSCTMHLQTCPSSQASARVRATARSAPLQHCIPLRAPPAQPAGWPQVRRGAVSWAAHTPAACACSWRRPGRSQLRGYHGARPLAGLARPQAARARAAAPTCTHMGCPLRKPRPPPGCPAGTGHTWPLPPQPAAQCHSLGRASCQHSSVLLFCVCCAAPKLLCQAAAPSAMHPAHPDSQPAKLTRCVRPCSV